MYSLHFRWRCILVLDSCFVDILLNRSQQLFSSCTARFADGQQCSVPVFDITHQTPLCDEHAKKMVIEVFCCFLKAVIELKAIYVELHDKLTSTSSYLSYTCYTSASQTIRRL